MRHIIYLSPVPTTETYQETLETQKGYYDPEKILKHREIKTNSDGYRIKEYQKRLDKRT